MRTFIIALLLFIVVSAGTWFILTQRAQMAGGPGMMGGMGMGGPMEVTAMTVEANTLDIYEELPGRTSAYKIAEIRPQVSGIVTERLFEEGSLVKVGQQLYQIDPTPYKAAHNSALASLKKAQANVKATQAKAVRYAELVIIDAVSKQEYDDVVAALDQAQADVGIAQASVARAKVDLDYTKVYAPIDGRIGKSNVTQGALVTAGQAEALATVTQLDPIYVDVTQSTSDILRLRDNAGAGESQNAPVTLTIEGEKEPYAHEGVLQFSEVTVDETTGTVKLRASFPNPDQILLPGMYVKAKIKQGSEENAIMIPQRAANRGADGTLAVWVIGSDGMVNPRPVVASREIGDQWLITDGLQPGEQIALDSFQKMQPGMPVKPVTQGQAPADEPGDMPPPPAPMAAPETGAETPAVTPDAQPAE